MASKEYKVKQTDFRLGRRVRYDKTCFNVVSWQGKVMCTCDTLYLANKIKKALNDGKV